MAFAIRKEPTTYFPKRKPKKNAGYLAWLHTLPCVVTGMYGVEAAHLSYASTRLGHYGRGKGTKAPDRWALPLSPEEHRKQHSMNEEAYWQSALLNSPHILALVLWGLYSEMGEDATECATAVIRQRLSE